jgi:hypothetical protein
MSSEQLHWQCEWSNGHRRGQMAPVREEHTALGPLYIRLFHADGVIFFLTP